MRDDVMRDDVMRDDVMRDDVMRDDVMRHEGGVFFGTLPDSSEIWRRTRLYTTCI
jgi:hypothetical protein